MASEMDDVKELFTKPLDVRLTQCPACGQDQIQRKFGKFRNLETGIIIEETLLGKPRSGHLSAECMECGFAWIEVPAYDGGQH